MKILLMIGILFSFNSFAKISYTCSNETWNQAEFRGNMYFVELQYNCQTSLDAADIDKIELLMVDRFQDGSDVLKVHEVGESELGTYVISNLKQSIKGRGDMNIKFHNFVGIDDDANIWTKSKSLNIKATGYSRYTKEIVRRRNFSIVDGKIHFVFREFDRIEKPRIAPKGIFVKAAKKGLVDNNKNKIQWLMNYLERHL
ncbi:MAG: hypothetical protein DRQ89_08000 [Epsilonproteobacteria bacterium]|nr:MAG: hypothetical protein DRQ89_08000 [Campylobacterota bacterium]